jgi:prepilin-type N-terminal cleavage/methylation domain-containing protein
MKLSRILERGFTLIEILVAIAIIGLLSAIIIVSLNNSRKEARDAKRKSEIVQIRTAIQMYALNNGGVFPTRTTSGCSFTDNTGGICLGHSSTMSCWLGWNSSSGCDNLNLALQPYMKNIPDDPLNNTSYYGDAYLYINNDSPTPNPVLHWGIEKIGATSKDCLGGAVGVWGNGKQHCTLPISI